MTPLATHSGSPGRRTDQSLLPSPPSTKLRLVKRGRMSDRRLPLGPGCSHHRPIRAPATGRRSVGAGRRRGSNKDAIHQRPTWKLSRRAPGGTGARLLAAGDPTTLSLNADGEARIMVRRDVTRRQAATDQPASWRVGWEDRPTTLDGAALPSPARTLSVLTTPRSFA